MKLLLIVKVEIISQSTRSRSHGVIVVEINLLILDTAPEAFNEDIVKIAASAVPTDGNIRRFESIGKGIRSELTALVIIEYQRFGLAKGTSGYHFHTLSSCFALYFYMSIPIYTHSSITPTASAGQMAPAVLPT